MAPRDDIENVSLRILHAIGARRLDDDTQQGWGIEKLLGVGDLENDGIIRIESAHHSTRREHAHDTKASVAEADPFSNRIALAE